MELGNKNLLYVDESFLDCYAPYTHNELQILYRFFKQFQIDKTLTVTLPFSIFQDMFHYETENLIDVICRLLATVPTRPFFVGGFSDRKVVSLFKRGYMNRSKNTVTIEFSEDVMDFFQNFSSPAIINLAFIQNFVKYKDRYCDEIKLYEYLSWEYNQNSWESWAYIPIDLKDLYFRCSTFEWFDKKYEDEYLKNSDILDMCVEITNEKGYRSKRYMWFIYSRSFISKDIEQINKWTDIFVDGYAPVRKGLQVTGVIFKVKRNGNCKDLQYIQGTLRDMSEEDQRFYTKCQRLYEKNHRTR